MSQENSRHLFKNRFRRNYELYDLDTCGSPRNDIVLFYCARNLKR